MTAKKLKPGDLYEGPKYIDTIDGVTAHYADTPGGPVRLVHIDLAPDDPQDGSEEYRVAGPDDPASITGNVVELEVEGNGSSSTEV